MMMRVVALLMILNSDNMMMFQVQMSISILSDIIKEIRHTMLNYNNGIMLLMVDNGKT